MFETFKNIVWGLKKVKDNNFRLSIERIINNGRISDEMLNHIDLWMRMYRGNPPWVDKENPDTLNLPQTIASEFARAVTLEMEAEISGSKMGDFLNEQFEKSVKKHLRKNVEYACATGGIIFKPYLKGDKVLVEAIQADSFRPNAYTEDLITSATFIYRKWDDEAVYTRLEKHTLEDNTYYIENTAFKSNSELNLGDPIALADVDEWADIDEKVKIADVKTPLFSYFKIPLGNTFDSHSPLGVSVYSRAVKTIRNADEQYRRMLWEYEGGELAIDASADIFKKDGDKVKLPEGKERLFRTNNIDPNLAHGEGLMSTFAPNLRDSNYRDGLTDILTRVETACSLSTGTLTKADEVERTATEMKITKQRFYSAVKDIQDSLEVALDRLIDAMYTIAYIYDLAPDGKYETSYQWDDSIVIDTEAERMRDMQEVNAGLMKAWEFRVKWYNETEEQAKEALKEQSENEIMGFNEVI